jgi:hypothetical protein
MCQGYYLKKRLSPRVETTDFYTAYFPFTGCSATLLRFGFSPLPWRRRISILGRWSTNVRASGFECVLTRGLYPCGRSRPPTPEVLASLTNVNYLRPAQLLSAFCDYLSIAGRGRIMLFSSIAVAAPRANNAAYSPAKAALESYCRALQGSFRTLDEPEADLLLLSSAFLEYRSHDPQDDSMGGLQAPSFLTTTRRLTRA